MKLIVISPEVDRDGELELVREMFAVGLVSYHLRKPMWTRETMKTWLLKMTELERARVVVHSHHDLVEELGLCGRHFPDDGNFATGALTGDRLMSRSCHDLLSLKSAIGTYDRVFISPIFESISKPGYGRDRTINKAELDAFLRCDDCAFETETLRTQIIGLGGVEACKIEECLEMGLDGVAVIGSVWAATDPVAAFETLQRTCCAAERSASGEGVDAIPRPPLMCITQDGLSLSHLEQAQSLCDAGARWVQLRMKGAAPQPWLATAREFVRICRRYGAVSIINDSVDVALAADADGVHLGKEDVEWIQARRALGPGRILGGTVNNLEDASRAVGSACLDYVGVGPWRFTKNKKNLAPVLGATGVAEVVQRLKGLPAWVIGGILPEDLPNVRAAGAVGVAVSSALFQEHAVDRNFRKFVWEAPTSLSLTSSKESTL